MLRIFCWALIPLLVAAQVDNPNVGEGAAKAVLCHSSESSASAMSASSQSAQSASNRLAEQASPTTQPQTSATTFSTISTQPQSVANAAQPSPTLTAGQQASLSPRYPTGPGTPNPVPTAGGAVTTSNPFGTGVPTFTANYLPGTGVGIESYQVPQSDQSGYILQGPGIAETELSSEVVISAFTTYVTFTVLLTSVYTSFPREYCSVATSAGGGYGRMRH